MDNYSAIIENFLHQEENQRLEFKKTVNLEVIAKTIVAFANSEGGDMIIGIGDDKTLFGVDDSANKANDIRDFLMKNVRPSVPFSVFPVEYKQKSLILISVWSGAQKPYSFKHIIYTSNIGIPVSASNQALSKMIEERKKADMSWERASVLAADLDDLDLEEIRQTIAEKPDIYPDFNEESFLIRQGLLTNGNLTNACLLLFGKNPTRFIPQAKIRITVYNGEKVSNSFVDDRIFEGNIFKNIKEIFAYLDVIYPKNIQIDGLVRTETKGYPDIAIREGILNAIVHRDYSSSNGFLRISIYPNKTTISNYGSLPPEISVSDLRKNHPSILRHPDIANICYIRKYIEMVGSGTMRIIAECKKNGFKAPRWIDENNILTLVFPDVGHHRANNVYSELEEKNEMEVEGIKVEIEGINEGIKKILQKIVLFISEQGTVKASDIKTYIGKSDASVERYLKLLKDAKIIEFVGAKKTGTYRIVKS